MSIRPNRSYTIRATSFTACIRQSLRLCVTTNVSLVEGYMDVISMSQSGVENVVGIVRHFAYRKVR